jgi:voltage-gated hydrogen channel 1
MDDNLDSGSPATALTPLLRSDRPRLSSLSRGADSIGRHILNVYGEDSWVWTIRRRLQKFLTSKWGHYFVIILVSLDVAGIFADFLISLHICEHAGEKGFHRRQWEQAEKTLGTISLVFSCLFMLELLCSIWAFGLELRVPPPLCYAIPSDLTGR